jgi:large subunit ribosomal protein L25
MAEEKIIEAVKRETKGTGNARRLRRTGKTPAVVYGTGEPQSISLDAHSFGLMIRDFGSNFIGDLVVDGGEVQKVLVKDVQYSPARGEIIHADFISVSMTETIQVTLPIELSGEPAGVVGGGVLDQILAEVEIECLPGNIVENIVVDVSAMEIGDTLMVGDIEMPEGVKNLTDVELAVVSVAAPRVADAAADDEEGTDEAAEADKSSEAEKTEE